MAVARRGRPPVRRSAAPAAKPARKAAVPQAKRRDVTEYAVKVPTPYHKAFAKWIVEEVGYNPDEARSLRAAFLKGVSIATAARPAFNSSDYIEEWRERTGETKRGPKEEESPQPAARRRKPAPEPEPEENDDEDEFDDESDELDDDDSEDDDADEFGDEDVDDDPEEDDSDDDEFDDEEEEAPAPKRGRPAKAVSPVKATARGRARASVPAKKAGRPAANTTAGTRASKADDDDFLF